MGVINTEVNAMLERPAIFADLINGLLHGGEQIVKPEDMTPLPLRNGIVMKKNSRRKAVERTGDVRMKVENDIYAVTFLDETQAKVDYGCPSVICSMMPWSTADSSRNWKKRTGRKRSCIARKSFFQASRGKTGCDR